MKSVTIINPFLCVKAPKYGFGTEPKLDEIKPKYDFYENDMFLDDPINADLKRKKKVCAPKIGTEPRVSISKFKFKYSNRLNCL